MARKYQFLTDDQQDERMVATFHAQEASHHSHAMNVERYTDMLTTLKDGPFKERIAALLITEQEALDQHEALLAATEKQLPESARAETAMNRLAVKGVIG